MSGLTDPFVHLPHLRGEIVDPTKSFYRSLDLEAMDARVRQAGGEPNWRHSDEAREASRLATLRGRSDGDLWVFAYGSLMWDPAFLFSEVRSAELHGYRRRFCLKTMLGRGTREKPGLMAGLDEGGRCDGLAFRIDRDCSEEETRIIWRREMLLPAYAPRLLPLDTPQGPVEALAFVIDQSVESYAPNLTDEETARLIASGVGILGTSLEYLENLAERFDILGIDDAELFTLRDRARELAALIAR